MEIDGLVGPQLAQHLDLLRLPRAAGVKVLAQGLVLHVIPADAHSQPQPAAAEHIALGRLLGHQGGLTLPEDQDCRNQLNGSGDSRKVAKEHKGLVEHAIQHIAALPVGVLGGVGAEHMVVDNQVREAKPLGRLNVVAHRRRVGPDLSLWKIQRPLSLQDSL